MKTHRTLAWILIGIAIAGLLGGIALIACNQVELGAVVWAATTVFSGVAAKIMKSRGQAAEESEA